MSEQVVRTRNVVGFGGAVLKGLAAAVVGGSIVLGGSQYFDRSQTSTVNIVYGTGSVLSYDDVNCTNTGGLAKYNTCYMANPVSGTASIVRIQVDSYKAPNAAQITCGTTPIGNPTGTASTLIRYFTTFSGSVIGTASGTVTGNAVNTTSPRILPGAGVRCWSSKTPGIGIKQRMRIWYNATYVP